MTKEKKLQDIIDQFNNMNENDIRSLLANEKCTGEPCNPDFCPVSNYLRRKTSCNTSVDDEDIMIGDNFFSTPTSVRSFIRNFDDECYPELIDETLRNSGV